MTIRNLLQQTQAHLTHGVPLPDLEARIFISEALHVSPEYVITHPDQAVTAEQEQQVAHAVQQRLAGVPLAYIRGRQEFYGRTFMVRPGVLIPRPVTELLITAAVRGPQTIKTAVDVGSGSGCIACTLAAEQPNWGITAIDPSPIARAVTTENAAALGVADRVMVVNGDLLSGVKPLPDLVIGNLPYLQPSQLQEPTIGREPLLALDGGDDGFELLQRLIDQLARFSQRPIGLILECDPSQVKKLEEVILSALRPKRHRLLGEEAVQYGIEAWWN